MRMADNSFLPILRYKISFLPALASKKPQVPFIHERYGRGPIMGADIQDGGSIRFFSPSGAFLISLDEISAAVGVFDVVSRRDDFLAVRSQDF